MKILILLTAVLISGCSGIGTKNIHDDRFTSGCAVVEGKGNTTLFSGEAAACKAVCSKDLPIGYRYKYKSNFCEFHITPETNQKAE